jgi:hypothetical protein
MVEPVICYGAGSAAQDTNSTILYWLGTNNGSSTEYRNPYTIGSLHVGGWIDDAPPSVREYAIHHLEAGSPMSRAGLADYRPRTCPPSSSVELPVDTPDTPFAGAFCANYAQGEFLSIDFRDIFVRPTHVSLRFAGCFGIDTDWNFEGSADGENWETLFEFRGMRRFLMPIDEQYSQLQSWMELRSDDEEWDFSEDEKWDFAVYFAEQFCRKTWALSPAPSTFYRYFGF